MGVMFYKIDELLRSVKGRLVRKGALEFYGISLDSREQQKGKAFFCLKGEKSDGHLFINQATQHGAVIVVIQQGFTISAMCDGVSVVEVKNTFEAMRSFAAYCRTKLTCPVVGVTGSNGKTTTKEMIAAIMSSAAGNSKQVLKSEENKNTDFGMALTLSRAFSDHVYCVLEMGMRGLGQIKRLAEVAVPEVGVITNIGSAHLEFLGTLDNVARAKGELFEMLPAGGFAIYPDDEIERLGKIAAHIPKENHWTFGFSPIARVQILATESTIKKSAIRLRIGNRTIDIEIPLLGSHNIKNAACAVAVCYALNIPEKFIRQGLSEFSLPGKRSDLYCLNGRWIIDDSYNANPDSMRAALAAFPYFTEVGRRFAVLGDMLELGEQAFAYHFEIGRYAASIGLQGLICVGDLAKAIAQGAREFGIPKIYECKIPEEAAEIISFLSNDGDSILFKGSRGIQLERAISTLKTLWSVQGVEEVKEKE